MSYPEISRLLAFLASPVLSAGLYHQAWKVWKTKSAQDFTLTIVVALALVELTWLNYGIAVREYPVIVLGVLDIPAVIWLIVGFRHYRRGRQDGSSAA